MLLYLLAHAGDGGSRYFPPIHPILVNFTAALIPTSFAADALGRLLKYPSLRSTGWWTLLLATAVTPLTVLVGWLWMRSMGDMDHWQMKYHLWLGVGIAAALVPVLLWRGWLQRRERPVGVPYFVVAAIVMGALGLQGELGGSMSFGHTLLFSNDDSGAVHRHADANDDGPGGTSGSMPDHHSGHASDSRPALSDGWRDHIDLDQTSTTKP